MTKTNYNERSWAIDLISDINIWLQDKNITIERMVDDVESFILKQL